MPPPSSGGTFVLQALGILEGFDLPRLGRKSPEALHLLAEAMKLAFLDRNHFLGDPDFSDVPLAGLLSPSYLSSRRALIDPRRASGPRTHGDPTPFTSRRAGARPLPPAGPSAQASAPPPGETHDTTSFAIADRFGNLLALTQTIGSNLASGVVVPGTGMVLNHIMSDFCPQVGSSTALGWGVYTSRANTIAPGKTPASSQAPTLVFKAGKPFLAIGAAGGSRIPTAVLQSIVNVLDWGMDVQEAISTPRIHDQGSGLEVERFWLEELRGPLEAMGHTVVRPEGGYLDAIRCYAQGAAFVPGGCQAGADPRADGLALGTTE